MPVRRIATSAEFAQLAGPWDRLAGEVPFRRWDWLECWWRHYEAALATGRQSVELYVLAVTDERANLLALAPWYLERSPSRGRVIHFLGSGEVCSDYLSVLCRGGVQQEVADELARWLARCRRSSSATNDDRWDLLSLTGVDAQDGLLSLLAERLREQGCAVHTRLAQNTWRIALPSSWPAYLEMLSKSHRKQLRRLERRYLTAGPVVTRCVTQPDDLDRGWRILRSLHQRRMESLGRPGCFSSTAFAAFHRETSERMFRSGRLRLHWLELEGRPIAAEYHLTGDGLLYAYQGGVDPDALAYEPGRLATLATLQATIADGFRGFDFLRGDEPYKAHWRAEPRANVELRIVANRSAARLRQGVWQVRENARFWIKRGLGV